MAHGTAGNAKDHLDQVAGWVPPLARIGYAAKGIVYILIGWLAFEAAAAVGQPEGATGALATLVDEQGGRVMLYAIAIGLLCHVAWRLVQAVLDPEHPGGDGRIGMRLFYALSALLYGSLALAAWQLARGDGAGQEGTEVWVAKMLEQPFGALLVMVAGAVIVAYGVHQLVKGWRGDVDKHMVTDPRLSRQVHLVGRFGTAARGAVLLPIGWFVFNAGRQFRAEEAADTGEVLSMLDQGWLLGIVGLGLLAYGLHQIAKARYRRIAPTHVSAGPGPPGSAAP